MALKREEGGVQPHIKWWRFQTRLPGIHVGMGSPSDVIQGAILATATAGAVAPLMMNYFQISFEVAWSVMFFQIFWVWAHTFLFGEPVAPGWITPLLPLTLIYLGGFTPGVEAVQAMTALMLTISAVFLFFGITKLGGKFFEWIPVELRAGIILGSAIAAFTSEFNRFETMPYTLGFVWAVVFLLMFSLWFQKAKVKNNLLKFLASMTFILGFLVAAIVGPLAGELSFNLQWGLTLPMFGEYLAAISPFSVGWPTWNMYVAAFPVAVMGYIVVFGDMIVANTLLHDADASRKDEKIIIDPIRTHFALFFRNIGHLLTGGPFIPLHGPIWTGGTVYLIEKYKNDGRKYMDSIFTGTINFYWLCFGLFLLTPVVTFMMPLLPVALSITLLLTGFALAYIGMRMVDTPTGRGYALFVGLATATFGPLYGIIVGVVLFFLLLVQRRPMIAIPYTEDVTKADVPDSEE